MENRERAAAECSDVDNQLEIHENEDSGESQQENVAKEVSGTQLVKKENMEGLDQSQKEPDVCGDKKKLTESGLLVEASSADNRENQSNNNDIGSIQTTKDEKLNPKVVIQKDQEQSISMPESDPVRPIPAQYSTSHHSGTVTRQPTRPYYSSYSGNQRYPLTSASKYHSGIRRYPPASRVNNSALNSEQNGSCCCPCNGRDTSDSCLVDIDMVFINGCDRFCDCLASCCRNISSCLGCLECEGSDNHGGNSGGYSGGSGDAYSGYFSVYGQGFGLDNNNDCNNYGGGDNDFGGGGNCDCGGGGGGDFGGSGDCGGGGDW